MVILLLGVLAYVLLGGTRIGRKRIEGFQAAIAELPRPETAPGCTA
ncbi:MAG: hypothetical protein ACK5ME_08840 [Parahaliea sp.]